MNLPGSARPVICRAEPSAIEIINDIKRGHVSPLDLIESAIERIEQVDVAINALPVRCFERAREQAKALMEARAKGAEWPLLCGLPMAIKDNADLGGVPTSGGGHITTGRVPPKSDPAIMRLERHGGIALGKSNLSELGGANTTNALFGPTANPWHQALTAGGSSGGSAAALAAGEVFFGHGNDVGGSLRTPAAFCGVTGLRPSPGLVPRKWMSDPFDTVFVEGPMARSVPDLALMLDAMAGQHVDDLMSHPADGISFSTAAENLRKPGKLAFSEDLGILPVETQVRTGFRSLIAALHRECPSVEEATPDFTGTQTMIDVLRGLAYAKAWGDHSPSNFWEFTPEVSEDIARGITVTGEDIAVAMRHRINLYQRTIDFFSRFDALICPTTQVRPFPLEVHWPRHIEGVPCANYTHWIAITYFWSMIGCPALTVTLGEDGDGLPLSLQIVGPPRSDARLISIGSWMEATIKRGND